MFGITPRRVVGLVLAACLFYCGIQYAEMYFYVIEFDDFIKYEVKFAPTPEGTGVDHLATHIANASQEYGVDVDPGQIKIQKTHNPTLHFDTLTVEVPYSAPVDLSVYKPQVRFHTVASITY